MNDASDIWVTKEGGHGREGVGGGGGGVGGDQLALVLNVNHALDIWATKEGGEGREGGGGGGDSVLLALNLNYYSAF